MIEENIVDGGYLMREIESDRYLVLVLVELVFVGIPCSADYFAHINPHSL